MTVHQRELTTPITQMSLEELYGYARLVLDDIEVPGEFCIEPVICEVSDPETGLPKINFTIARKSNGTHIGHVLLKWVTDDTDPDMVKLQTYWWLLYDNTADEREIIWSTRVELIISPFYAFHTIFAIKAR